MTDLTTKLQEIRTARSQVEIMSQCVAEPVRLPGRVTGAMAINMMYQQVDREKHAARFQAVLDKLDRHEQEVLAKIALEEVSV